MKLLLIHEYRIGEKEWEKEECNTVVIFDLEKLNNIIKDDCLEHLHRWREFLGKDVSPVEDDWSWWDLYINDFTDTFSSDFKEGKRTFLEVDLETVNEDTFFEIQNYVSLDPLQYLPDLKFVESFFEKYLSWEDIVELQVDLEFYQSITVKAGSVERSFADVSGG